MKLSPSSKISARSFRMKHPLPGLSYPTDLYYAGIASRVFSFVQDAIDDRDVTRAQIEAVALNIAAYFEDVVSEIGQWRAFIDAYKERYGQWLPFYNTTDDYYEDSINPQDVCFIFWLTMLRERDGRLPNPENHWINSSAQLIFDFLDNEYETAPANDTLRDFIYSEKTLSVFGDVKGLILWMAERSFVYGNMAYFNEKVEAYADMLKQMAEQMGDSLITYSALSHCALEIPIGPLAMKGTDILGDMCRNHGIPNEVIDDIHNIKVTDVVLFKITECVKDREVVAEGHNGETYHIAYSDFDRNSIPHIKRGNFMMGQICYYGDMWHICGFMVFADNTKATENTYNEWAEDYESSKGIMSVVSSVEAAQKAIDRNKGERLFFFDNLDDMSAWHRKTFGSDIPAVDRHAREMFSHGALLFITDDWRMMLGNAVEGIRHHANKYYNSKNAAEEGLRLVGDTSATPVELLQYLLDNDLIPDAALRSLAGQEHGRHLVHDNIAFWVSCLRGETLRP